MKAVILFLATTMVTLATYAAPACNTDVSDVIVGYPYELYIGKQLVNRYDNVFSFVGKRDELASSGLCELREPTKSCTIKLADPDNVFAGMFELYYGGKLAGRYNDSYEAIGVRNVMIGSKFCK